jgi:MFS family permease
MAEAVSVDARAGQSGGDFRAMLGNRNFLYLWVAQVFSQLAQQMINYALVVQVSELTGSSAATAGIIICFTVPAIFFSAIAGVFVDRRSKKRMLVATNVARGVVVLLYVLTVALPHLDQAAGVLILYVNTLIFSAVSQFFVPAEAAMIPLLVPREKLIAANSLFNLTFTASQLIGFAFLGPVVVGIIGYKWLYVILFSFYVICAGLTWLLPEMEAARRVEQAGRRDEADGLGEKMGLAWGEFMEGWRFIRRDAALTGAILYWSVAISVFMMMGTIGPSFLKNVLHIDPQHLYFIMVPGGIGLVLGVIVVGRFATEENRPAMINYSLGVAGVLLLALALTHDGLRLLTGLIGGQGSLTLLTQVIMGALAFCLGVINSFISVPAQTVLQEHAPEHIRARVFSAFFTVSNAILIVPLVFAGALGDLLGEVQTVVLIALAVLIIAGLGLRYQQRHAGALIGGAPADAGRDGVADAEPPALPDDEATWPAAATGARRDIPADRRRARV